MATSTTGGAGAGDGLSPGDRVGSGRYLLKRLLGRGTSGEVWLAQDAKASRTVALKFLPRAFLADTNLVERLKQMAQRHLLVKHSHIAMTYELVADSATLVLAVEYVEGWSLASMKVDRLGGYYRVEEIEGWVAQLCSALEFAHNDLGIVHSDLKPSNLLVNAQEELMVTDFEIAFLVRKESSRRGLSKGLYGGLGFLSPQQVMGEEPSRLDDIYSLGATIFDLLTGTAPFYKGEIFAQICSLKPPTMTARLKELGMQDDPVLPVWEDAVARCLAKNPADRPQSVGEVVELLKRSALAKAEEVVPEEKTEVLETPGPTAEIQSEETEKSVEPTVPETASVDKSEAVSEAVMTPDIPPPAILPMAMPPHRSQMPLILGGLAVLAVAVCAAGVMGFIALKHEIAKAPVTENGTNAVVEVKPGSPGSIDDTFNVGEGANDEVRAMTLQPDGRILVAGRFSLFNAAPHRGIVRLNADGSIDDSFKFQANGAVHGVALTVDGGIFVCGESMLKGHPRDRVMRLGADGEVDRSFNFGSKLNFEIRAMLLEPNGPVVVGGHFTTVNNKKQAHIMRFGADGKPDEDFNSNVSADGIVWALTLQPDGKILVGGTFNKFNDVAAGRLVRLNNNGTLDSHFNIGTGADGPVYAVTMLADGSILIGGDFTHVNGQACPRLARLNADGTVDPTFNIGAGADRNVRTVVLQPDGKILVLGEFVAFAGAPCHRIVRLNADGSLDHSFNTGSGAADSVNSAIFLADGKMLIGGAFMSFNGTAAGGIVELNDSTNKNSSH